MKQHTKQLFNLRQKERFRVIRKMAILYLGGKCSVCSSMENLQFHHKDGNSNNNEITNFILVCVSCHKKVNNKVGYRKYAVIDGRSHLCNG